MSNDLIAKKYANAIISSNDSYKISSILFSLKEIVPAFCDKKFVEIIDSMYVSSSQKVDFVLSLVSNAPYEVVNFIKLLGEKKRLSIIPSVVSIIDSDISAKNNTYNGIVYSKMPLQSSYLSDLSISLSNKFNKNIYLEYVQNDYDGIKVDIEGLGVEIGFSKDRFKKSVAEHILKAV